MLGSLVGWQVVVLIDDRDGSIVTAKIGYSAYTMLEFFN